MTTSRKTKRAKIKTAAHIKRLGAYRMLVRRTNQNIYACLIDPSGKMLLTVSSLSADAKKKFSYGGNIQAAKYVGELFAKASLKKGIKKIAFDRGGFRYHGRIKSLADGAREAGLEF